MLLSYARQPEGHNLALIAAQPPPFLCVLKCEGCAATSADYAKLTGKILQGCMVNQVFVAAHTSVVDFLEFDTSLQWKAKLADFILRKEKVSFRIPYNKSKSIT